MYLFKNKKSPFYQIQYLNDGSYTTKSTKAKSKAEALKFLFEFQENQKDKKKIVQIKLTVFQSEYINYLTATKSNNYLRNVKLAFSQLIAFTGDMQLKAVNVKIVDQFISSTFSRAPQAALSYYRILKAAFNRALSWNYIFVNPFTAIKPPKIKSSFPVFISDADLNLIIDATKEQFLKSLFLLAFHSGMRVGEIVNLTWKSIQLDQRTITVSHLNGFTTKSKKERVISINSKLFELLSDLYPKVRKLGIPEYVFCRVPGIKLAEDFVSKKFKAALREAELDDRVHFHSLRHSFASNLVRAGVSLLTVKELLGHSDFRITQLYSHLQQGELSLAVEKLVVNN